MPSDIPHAHEQPAGERPRPHHGAVITLIIVGAIVGVLATVALWAARQALDSDEWARTSGALLADSTIEAALSSHLVSTLFTNVDVKQQLQGSLPPDLQPIAVPATAGLRLLAERAARAVLQTPVVQKMWVEANRAAHKTLMAAVHGGSDALTTTGGVVALNLAPLVERVGTQLGLDVEDKIPEGAGTIEVLRSEQLAQAQVAAQNLQFWGTLLPILSLILFAIAVYVARGWRRRALEDVGIAFIVVGALVLIGRALYGNYLVDSVATTQSMEPVAQSVWNVGTSLLAVSALSLVAYGIVILVGAWLVGPSPRASRVRNWMAPVVERRGIAYAILALILVLIFWWQPIPSTRHLLPSLILIALVIAGFEAIRSVTLREAAGRAATGPTEPRDVEAPRPQRKIG